jgi:hypothetical protein
MFCALGLVFGRTESVSSHFNVLRTLIRFGRRVSFSRFALTDSFWVVPMAPGPVFMFCAHGLIFDGTKGVGSHLHVLCSRTRFGRYRGSRVPFSCFALLDSFSAVPRTSGLVSMFCAPGLVFGGS